MILMCALTQINQIYRIWVKQLAITIKEIAELAGVSIGTVDRALHNRGRVSAEVAQRIKEIAKEHNYEPSRAARALALSKNPIKIGVIAHLTKTEFMKQVVSGISTATEEVEKLGAEVILHEIPSLDVQLQLEAIESLMKQDIHALAISPVEDKSIEDKINDLVEKKIPVVTFNTDIGTSKRLCFVGLDNERSGRASAGLMAMLLQNQGKIAVVTGYLTNWANRLRVDGFAKEIENHFPNMSITGVHVCSDEDEIAEEITEGILNDKDISGIFVSGGGQAGVCRAVEKSDSEGRVKLIAHDMIPNNIKYLKEDILDFVIDQNAFDQGYKPIIMLFELLFANEKQEDRCQYTDIIIKTKYNL